MRTLEIEQMSQIEGGGCNEIVGASSGGGAVLLASIAAAKKGATLGSILGPKGALGGALIGASFAAICYILPE